MFRDHLGKKASIVHVVTGNVALEGFYHHEHQTCLPLGMTLLSFILNVMLLGTKLKTIPV